MDPMSFAAGFLEDVEGRLRDAVRGDGLLGAAAAHLVDAPAAKRARPRLVRAFGVLAQVPPSPALQAGLVAAGAAVELIHTASLLHDDVVDEAAERRGRPSANARFGNSAAVLAGDLVLARALGLLSFDPRAVAAAIDVVSAMSVAAVREVEVRGRSDLPLAEHRAIADGKTAALFGLCGRLAGLVAGDADAAARFEDAGRSIGLAFQLADDAGDVETDLCERTPTHPILVGAREDAAVGQGLAALWAPRVADRAAAAQLAARILAGPAVPATLDVVNGHVAAARRALAPWEGAEAHAEIFRFAVALGTTPATPAGPIAPAAVEAVGRQA